MAMKFKVTTPDAEDKAFEKDFTSAAPLKSTVKKKKTTIGFALDNDVLRDLDDYLHRFGGTRSFFIRNAVNKEIEKIQAQEKEKAEREKSGEREVWLDEPFLVKDASVMWNVSEEAVEKAIRRESQPSFDNHECKYLNSLGKWVVTRRGMNRVFGHNSN